MRNEKDNRELNMYSNSIKKALDECADIRILNPKTGETHEEKGLVIYSSKTEKLVALGNECLSFDGTDPDLKLVAPIVRGEIIDYVCTEQLFSWMYHKYVCKKHLFIKKSVLICVDEPVSPINIRAYEDAIILAGGGNFKDVQFMGASVTQRSDSMTWDECIEKALENRKDIGCVLRVTKKNPSGYARSFYQEYLDRCKRWNVVPEEKVY